MKKYIYLFAAILGLGTTVHAQTSGWETGINASVGASDQFYTQVEPEAAPFMDNLKKTYGANLYYSAGAYGRKFFKDSYGIELGVQYTSFAQASKKMDAVGLTGTVEGTARFTLRHDYVEIPVRFVFKKDIGMFGIGCFAGLAPAFVVHGQQRILVQPNDGDRQTIKDNLTKASTQVNVFADAGLLLRANISSHFALDLKPFFRVAALPTFSDDVTSYYKGHYFGGGLSVSTVWKF